MVDIFSTAYHIMITIFILAVIWILAIFMFGGYLHPMITSQTFSPGNNSSGVSQTQYISITDKLWFGVRIFFYMLIAVPFVYLIIKYLYEKEETSVRYGYP